MMSVLMDQEVETTTTLAETGNRYKVSVYLEDSDIALTFDVGSARLAREAVEWCAVDPRVVRIEVMDMLTGGRISTWTQ